LFIGLLALGFMSPVLFSNRALLPGEFLTQMQPFSNLLPAERQIPQWNVLLWDSLAQYYPWRLFARRSLRSGEIPLWNPHQFCGAPFVANGQSAVFYPLNILFWFLPPARAFGWSAFLHIFLAGVFMFALGRETRLSLAASLLSAISFMFCGFIITWLELPTLVNAAIWIPAVFWCSERLLRLPRTWLRDSVLLTLFTGMNLLAGHLQVSLYLMLAVVLRLVWAIGSVMFCPRTECRPRWLGVGIVIFAVSLGVVLAMIQLLPTAEMARYSHRGGGRSIEAYQWYVSNAMSPLQLGRLFLPDLFGNPTKDFYWGPGVATAGQAAYTEYCGYIGFLPVLFVLCALPVVRRTSTGFFALLMIFSLLVALGTSVTYPLYFGVPGFSQMGGFSRILILFCFSAALLAGAGWEHAWLRSAPSFGRDVTLSLALGCVAFAISYVSFHVAASDFAQSPPPPTLWVPLISLCGWTMLVAWRTRAKSSHRFFSSATLALVSADMLFFASRFNPTAPAEKIFPALQIAGLSSSRRARVLPLSRNWSLFHFPQALLPPNSMTVYRQYDIQGYDSLQTRAYKNLMSRLEKGSPCPPENGNMILLHNYHSPIINLLGVRHILSAEPLAGMHLRLVNDSPIYVYENRAAWAAAFVVDQLPDLDRLEGESPPPECELISYSNLRVSIAPCRRGRFLALTDTFYPGWRAYADGEEAPVLVWAEALRAVRLPEDMPARVDWVFLPNSFRVGEFLSLLAILAMMGLLGCRLSVIMIRHKPRPPNANHNSVTQG